MFIMNWDFEWIPENTYFCLTSFHGRPDLAMPRGTVAAFLGSFLPVLAADLAAVTVAVSTGVAAAGVVLVFLIFWRISATCALTAAAAGSATDCDARVVTILGGDV